MTIQRPDRFLGVTTGRGMLSSERLLIVEEEYLIGLDIQRIVAQANAAETLLVRDFREAAALGERLAGFDLAIVNPPRNPEPGWTAAAQLRAAGVTIIVCTAAQIVLDGTPIAGSEIVYKPFSDGDMLDACRRALERRGRCARG
jgi:hypothetical protein